MIIFSRKYRNLFGDSIELSIYRYTNCCEIIITYDNGKKCGMRWYRVKYIYWCLCSAIIFMIILSSIITLNHLKIQNIEVNIIVLLIILLLFWFLYWKSPVVKETLILLDNVSGIEIVEHNYFGQKRSQLLNTNHLVINEAITMHRVIYYLVAIFPSVSSLLLSPSSVSSNELSQKSNSSFTRSSPSHSHELVPLYRHTCPRLDCLKVIHQHIESFKANQSHLKHRTTKDDISVTEPTIVVPQKNGFLTPKNNH